MAVLKLLTTAAPARLVAPELLVLVEAPGLDVDRLGHLVHRVLRGLRDARGNGSRGRRGERARLVLGAAAGVAQAAGRARPGGGRPVLAGTVLALHLDL